MSQLVPCRVCPLFIGLRAAFHPLRAALRMDFLDDSSSDKDKLAAIAAFIILGAEQGQQQHQE